MVDNTNQQPNIERVRDLLSPYLDGEVTNEERTLVEQALATSSELREDLESLRQTVTLVASLPRVAAPRPFTLSEADVSAAPPAPKRYFGLPAWASGLAVLAAALICVLAAGGIFLRGQFSGGMLPAAEIAQHKAEEPVAEEAAPAAEKEIVVEKEAALEAPQEEAAAAEAAPTEPSDKEELAAEEPAVAAPTEMPAPAEAPAPAEEAEEPTNEVGMVEAEKSVADEAAEATAPWEDGAVPSDEADTDETGDDRGGEGGESGVDLSVAPTPTLAPLATPSPTSSPAPLPTPSPALLTIPATEIAEEQAIGKAESEAPAGAGVAPPPASEVQPEQKEGMPRPVEIKNQKLSITPGLIQIEGIIEAAPGSTLEASLQRNEEPFDSWADPASLQTTVQANGQFSFNIQANAAQRNRDLFALEPANYQITITSVDTDAPVIASIFFDTSGPPTVTPLPTVTSLPPSPTASPSPTVIARLTFVPTATPTTRGTDVSPVWPVGVGIVVLGGVLVIVGLIVWLVIRRRQ